MSVAGREETRNFSKWWGSVLNDLLDSGKGLDWNVGMRIWLALIIVADGVGLTIIGVILGNWCS